MSDLPKKTIDVKFTKSPDYRIIASTGAWGGPTPQGEIVCNFFVEYNDPPESVTVELPSEGQPAKETAKVVKGYMNRELQVGILLRPDIAKSIGEWLVRNAETLMKPIQKH